MAVSRLGLLGVPRSDAADYSAKEQVIRRRSYAKLPFRLPAPPPVYSQMVEAQRNAILEDADVRNMKTDRDIDVGGRRLVIQSPNGARWEIKVDNAGNVTASAIESILA